MANRTKLTPKKQRQFLARIADGWSITDGAKAVGVRRETIYAHKAADPAFAAALTAAVDAGTDVLEDAARQRAVDGVVHETPIYHQGKPVGKVVETKYSDSLLIFLLKARRPEKYRDQVDVHVWLAREAKRVAEAEGLDAADVLREAEFELAAAARRA
jgi:hypothetical protein